MAQADNPYTRSLASLQAERRAAEERVRLDTERYAAERRRRSGQEPLAKATERIAGTPETGSEDRVNGHPVNAQDSAGSILAEARGIVEDAAENIAVEALPPIRNCLVLAEQVDKEDVMQLVPYVRTYTWYSEDHFNDAHRWLVGLCAAQQAGLPTDFFKHAIVDRYYYDRALRGAELNSKTAPIRTADVPETMGYGRYHLQRRDFRWSTDTPVTAVNAVAAFVANTPPDKLWIAHYIEKATTYDPIIYASFGSWEVEIARWG